jgi:hypothetical protein
MNDIAIEVITLGEPSLYYCPEDEDHFFGWLQAAPAVRAVKGRPEGLSVSIATPIDDQSLRSLLGLLARYGVKGTPLRALCTRQNEKWFKHPGTYWYASVFED